MSNKRMERLILEELQKQGEVDFYIFRSKLPFSDMFQPAYNNLIKLNLIEETRLDDNCLVGLTDEGVGANFKGVDKWIKSNLLKKIGQETFQVTKDLTSIEVKALQDLKSEGRIEELPDDIFKVTSKPNSSRLPPDKRIKVNGKNNKWKYFSPRVNKWVKNNEGVLKITGLITGVIAMIISILQLIF